jgi:hypothetical protein
MRTTLVLLATAALLGSVIPAAHAQPIPPPGPDAVWVPPHVLRDGSVVPGHWREPVREGYVWVAPTEGPEATWGYWRPVKERRGHVWEPGYVTADGYWVDGHWRPVRRSGYRWVAPHVSGGVRVAGFWAPREVRVGFVWEAGFVGPFGWVDGTWRPAHRAGWVWHAPYHRHGVWYAGEWVPAHGKPGKRWARGHWKQGRWHEGRWERGHHGRGVRHAYHDRPGRRPERKAYERAPEWERRGGKGGGRAFEDARGGRGDGRKVKGSGGGRKGDGGGHKGGGGRGKRR